MTAPQDPMRTRLSKKCYEDVSWASPAATRPTRFCTPATKNAIVSNFRGAELLSKKAVLLWQYRLFICRKRNG